MQILSPLKRLTLLSSLARSHICRASSVSFALTCSSQSKFSPLPHLLSLNPPLARFRYLNDLVWLRNRQVCQRSLSSLPLIADLIAVGNQGVRASLLVAMRKGFVLLGLPRAECPSFSYFQSSLFDIHSGSAFPCNQVDKFCCPPLGLSTICGSSMLALPVRQMRSTDVPSVSK